MLTKTQKVRLGIFLIVGLVLVGGGIALLAGMSLFKRYDYYKIHFRETVSGLSPGSPVKVRGVEVGRVESITINEEDVEVVDVEIRVRRGLPILEGSVAQLATGGITGLKHIEITGGDKGGQRLESGAEIPAIPSKLTRITGKAEAIAFKAEQLLNNALNLTTPENRDKMVGLVQDTRVMVKEVGKSAATIRELLVLVRPEFVRALTELRRASRKIRHAASSVEDLMDTTKGEVRVTFAEARGALRNLRKISDDDGELKKTFKSLRRVAAVAEKKINSPGVEGSLSSLQSSLKAMKLLMIDVRAMVNRASVNIRPVLRSARNAAEHLEEFARSVRENPAALLRPSTSRKRKLPRK